MPTFLLSVVYFCIQEYYKAYAGIHCDGTPYHVNYLETDTIESCNEACDSHPQCAAYAIRDNWSIGGCYLKNEACLENMNPKPGVTMFVKPSMYFNPKLNLSFHQNLMCTFI